MDVISLILILLTIAGLFIWNRAEGRADARHLETIIQADRNLVMAIREEGIQFREELRAFREQMNNETKEFHNKLLEIEKSRK